MSPTQDMTWPTAGPVCVALHSLYIPKHGKMIKDTFCIFSVFCVMHSVVQDIWLFLLQLFNYEILYSDELLILLLKLSSDLLSEFNVIYCKFQTY
jgi:hypothetical protein